MEKIMNAGPLGGLTNRPKIDEGTHWVQASPTSSPLGIMMSLAMGAAPPDPKKAQYDKDHVYSTAPEATTKRNIDLQIIGGDYGRGGEVRIDNPIYLKRLIELASGGKQQVLPIGAKEKLQFFIIGGGAEGLLPNWLMGKDAHNFEKTGSTTTPSGKADIFRFDENDLLTVFDGTGKLISSARLERPIFITDTWGEGKDKHGKTTPERVWDAWTEKAREVFIYKNDRNPAWIPYLGLGVNDGLRGKAATVDMHKQEDTNGCIFIIDEHTPVKFKDSKDRKKQLSGFEPQLIKDILASIGKKVEDINNNPVSLGVLRVIEIK
jgi:hypothetical protein